MHGPCPLIAASAAAAALDGVWQRRLALLALLALLAAWPPARAEELGLGLALSAVSLRDPAGPVARQTFLEPGNLHYRWQPWRDGRLRVGMRWSSRRFARRAGRLAQRAQRLAIELGYERRWRLAACCKPWLQVSAAYVSESFSDRELLDGEGYRSSDAPLGARERSGLALGVGLAWDIAQARRWRMSLAARAVHPLYRGSKAFGLELLCMFGLRAAGWRARPGGPTLASVARD